MDPAARPVRDAGRPALATVRCRNGWGHHAGRVAVDWAIEAVAEAWCGDGRRPQLQPLRDRRLVRAAGGRRGDDRHLPLEHLAARGADAGPACR